LAADHEQIRVVEGVEEFSSVLDADPLGDPRGLVEAHVQVPHTRPAEGVAARHAPGERSELRIAGDGVDEAGVESARQIQVGKHTGRGRIWRRVVRASLRYWASGKHPRADSELCVRAVEDREREPMVRREDGRNGPSVQDVLGHTLRAACERDVPDAADGHPLPEVEIGITLVQLGVERVEQAQVEVVERLAERRTEVINCVSPGVVERPRQPGVTDVVPRQADIQRVVG